MNIGYILERTAKNFPDREGLVVGGRRLTFKELNERVNQLANALLAQGLKKGDRVGLLFYNSLAYFESYLALYKAGLIWVRLNYRLSISELKNMMEDSQASAIIHGPEFGQVADEICSSISAVKQRIHQGKGPGLEYEKFLSSGSKEEPAIEVDEKDLSDIWYTSGTTGEPKGIMITHGNILTCVQFLLSDVYWITEADRLLTVGALSHAGSVRVLPFLSRGALNILHRSFEPLEIFKTIEKEKITDISTVPTMLLGLMDHPERRNYDLSSLKTITYAGAPTPVERIKEAVNVFGPILDQSFGQAESIITITHLTKHEHIFSDDPEREKRLASVGREYPGVKVKVVNEKDEECAPGEIGEVITKSENANTMANQLTQVLVGALGIKGATIFVLNPELEELEILASSGLSINYVNKGPVLVDKSIKLPSNREPVIISDVTTSDRLQYPEKAKEEEIRAIVSLPITLRGKIVGALRLYHSEVWDITERDVEHLQVVAQNIGIALMYFRLANAVLSVKETVNEVHSVWL